MFKLQQENEILKKYSHIRQKVTDEEITTFIDQENDQCPIRKKYINLVHFKYF